MVSFAQPRVSQPELAGMWTFLGHVAAVSPALIGIGVGGEPQRHASTRWSRATAISPTRSRSWSAAPPWSLVSYVLALVGVLDNWWFASITIATVFMLPVIGQWLMPDAVLGEEEAARRRPLDPGTRSGIDEPYSAEVRDEIDRELGISEYLSTPPARTDKELVTHG